MLGGLAQPLSLIPIIIELVVSKLKKKTVSIRPSMRIKRAG